MYIICSGKTSQVLANLCVEELDIHVIGVNLNDLILTIKNRGVEHFKDVNKLIVTDGALDTLMDVTILNELTKLNSEIYFLNRFSNITKTNLLDSDIRQINVKEIGLSDIKQIILED